MRNKTDRNDARGIAQMMRLGWYRAAHVKNIDMQKMRTLLTSRKLLKRKLIDLEDHIRGALRAYGLLVGAVARGAYEARVRELIEHSDPIFVMTIEAMLEMDLATLPIRQHPLQACPARGRHRAGLGSHLRPCRRR